MLQQMGMTHLEEQLRELMEKLMGVVEANREAVSYTHLDVYKRQPIARPR